MSGHIQSLDWQEFRYKHSELIRHLDFILNTMKTIVIEEGSLCLIIKFCVLES